MKQYRIRGITYKLLKRVQHESTDKKSSGLRMVSYEIPLWDRGINTIV